MDKTQKFVVWIVLTVVPMGFTPLLEIPSGQTLSTRGTPLRPWMVGCGAILLVSGALLGGKALLDRTIPRQDGENVKGFSPGILPDQNNQRPT